MKIVLVSLALMALLAPIAFADGVSDYKAYCAGCHGANANVQTEKAKALKMDVRKLALRASRMNKAEMMEIVQHGKGDMPGFKDQLGKARIMAIVDYIMALRKK